MTDPFVVVGGDAAGLSAASKLKREEPDREVIAFDRDAWVSFAHCGMPYYVKGEVEALTDMLSLRPEDIEERGIDLRRHHEVVGLDAEARTVTVDGPDGRFDQPYGDLLVATGATADRKPFDLPDGAFTLHHFDDAAAIRAFLTPPEEFSMDDVGGGEYVDESYVRTFGERDPPTETAVVGGGYVGVEMAEALSAWDVTVHLFQRSAHVLRPFGERVGERVEAELTARGVEVHTGAAVERLREEDGRLVGVDCPDISHDVGLAVVGIGVRPAVGFLRGSGVEFGETGAIAVDEYGRTNLPDVYAAGDCAEAHHVVTGEPTYVPLGLTANRAGRAIGTTVAGDPTPVGSIAGTAVVKAFDLECGRAGLLADEARDAGFDPVTETVTAGSRSGYYPGAAETDVTLVADRASGRLLGGSIVGTDRAAVRIDTLATALEAGMTVAAFERLDLAYAPPFSPVWDPLLVAAKVLNGSLDG